MESKITTQMKKGVIEYIVLAVIAKGEVYASDIIDILKRNDLILVEGTLYPLLTRQKNQGMLSYRWEESPQGPPRKYYSITDKGKEVLAEMDAAWKELVETIELIRNNKSL